MSGLADFVIAHAERGECRCGRCIDAGDSNDQPEGHTADVFMFNVTTRNDPDSEVFTRLARDHVGDFCEVDVFDGRNHSYVELGAWIGDQGIALMFMGMGSLLGVFTLMTPRMLPIPEDLQSEMAGMGMITVSATTSTETKGGDVT